MRFPPPAGGQPTVALPEGQQAGGRPHVSSAAGQVLVQRDARAASGNETLDISLLPAGIYFLQLFSAEGQLVGSSKFVKAM